MSSLTNQRCFNHGRREAVARCPECSRFYCRECVTEHNNRVLCASCLRKTTESNERTGFSIAVVGRLLAGTVSFLLLWLFFFLAGQLLLLLPDSFHAGAW